jgi:hypothetical protein
MAETQDRARAEVAPLVFSNGETAENTTVAVDLDSVTRSPFAAAHGDEGEAGK